MIPLPLEKEIYGNQISIAEVHTEKKSVIECGY